MSRDGALTQAKFYGQVLEVGGRLFHKEAGKPIAGGFCASARRSPARVWGLARDGECIADEPGLV